MAEGAIATFGSDESTLYHVLGPNAKYRDRSGNWSSPPPPVPARNVDKKTSGSKHMLELAETDLSEQYEDTILPKFTVREHDPIIVKINDYVCFLCDFLATKFNQEKTIV